MGTYRPRGALARAAFEKVHNDQYLERYDMKLWYSLSATLTDKYQCRFVDFEQPDQITLSWLEEAKALSSRFWLQLWHLVARVFLMAFMTQTDVNGLLKRGSMFILSEYQFASLLSAGGFDLEEMENSQMIDILDIGAGDGEVTSRLAKSIIEMGSEVYLKVYTTDQSWTMKDRLQKKKFVVIDKLNEVNNVHLVSCLNVLDRCADPHAILEEIYSILAPNGRAIIALVLPYTHYVESNSTHRPVRPLFQEWPDIELTFEEAAQEFFEQLELMGFQIESWTKAPYLCEGDLRQSYYWLTDVVVVVSKKVLNNHSIIDNHSVIDKNHQPKIFLSDSSKVKKKIKEL